MYLKDKDIDIGSHCWALSKGELLIVLKTGKGRYEVCGAWECGIGVDDIDIIEVINRPTSHKETKLYYLER